MLYWDLGYLGGTCWRMSYALLRVSDQRHAFTMLYVPNLRSYRCQPHVGFMTSLLLDAVTVSKSDSLLILAPVVNSVYECATPASIH